MFKSKLVLFAGPMNNNLEFITRQLHHFERWGPSKHEALAILATYEPKYKERFDEARTHYHNLVRAHDKLLLLREIYNSQPSIKGLQHMGLTKPKQEKLFAAMDYYEVKDKRLAEVISKKQTVFKGRKNIRFIDTEGKLYHRVNPFISLANSIWDKIVELNEYPLFFEYVVNKPILSEKAESYKNIFI